MSNDPKPDTEKQPDLLIIDEATDVTEEQWRKWSEENSKSSDRTTNPFAWS